MIALVIGIRVLASTWDFISLDRRFPNSRIMPDNASGLRWRERLTKTYMEFPILLDFQAMKCC
jgi:hypothetical protein